MSLVAMNTWRCGRSATLIASIARCGSPSLQRASAATAIPPRVSWAIRRTASKSPGRGGREAGLDDVDLEPRELAGDLELLGGGQPGAGRLLAVAQGGVEDADAARRHERPGGPGYWRALTGPRPGVVAAAWAWPACDLDRVEERHLGTQPRADPLDEVVVVGRAQALELVPARRRSRRSSGSANVPSWISLEDVPASSRGRGRR